LALIFQLTTDIKVLVLCDFAAIRACPLY